MTNLVLLQLLDHLSVVESMTYFHRLNHNNVAGGKEHGLHVMDLLII